MNNTSSSIASYSSSGNSNPFTANQWQELEHQALVYKYLISGLPVPPDLLFPLKPSSSPPFHVGWTMPGRKMDPEPWRCRRTDGKKWRCSKEAASPDSKYCERHMHRGKSRSRKHMEQQQQQLMSGSYSQLKTDYRYSYELKSEPPGATRNFSVSSREGQEAWQLTPLTISSSYSTSSRQSDHSSSNLQRQSVGDFPRQETLQPNHRYFCATKLESGQDPHKTIHRFFDEGPIRGRDSWLDPDDKKSSSDSSTTRLSISMPSSSSNDLPLLGSRRD